VAKALGPLFSGVEALDLGFSIDERVVEFSPWSWISSSVLSSSFDVSYET